jgi:hypothetical protein
MKFPFLQYFQLSVFLIFITALYSCTDDTADIDYYIIKIDSLNTPDSVFVSDTLGIHLQGVIGNDGCYSFHRYEDYLSNNILDLTVWGKHVKNSVCPLVLRYG